MNKKKLVKAMVLGAALFVAGTSTINSSRIFQDALTKPNLLFIMTDQQTYHTLSRAGNKVLYTPNLDRLASEGVYFKNAYAYCPVCVPSRSVILTGYSTESLGVRSKKDYDSPDVADVPTFDNILSKYGWYTEYHGKWHAPYKFSSTYNNFVRETGEERRVYLRYLSRFSPQRPAGKGELVDNYSERPYRPDPIDWRYGVPAEKHPDYDRQSGMYGNLDIPFDRTRTAFTVEETIEALESVKDIPKPFSITCSIGPPHPPTVLPEPYYGMYPIEDCNPPISITDPMDNSPYAQRASQEEMQRYKDEHKVRYMISDYYGMVKEIDDWIGRLLQKLEELGFKNNTLIIFTSDHGEMLGAHGLYSKYVFYEESAHIPLIMRFPGVIPPGTIVLTPVSQINLFSTILDYLGVNEHKSEGHSLRPLVEGRAYAGFDFCVSEWPSNSKPNFMVRWNEWKFMFAKSPESKALNALYNLRDDPYEMNNLIGNNIDRGKYFVQAEEMKKRLVTWLEIIDSPDLQGVMDRVVIEDEPPVVSILAPENKADVSASLIVNAEIINEIGIKKVEFRLNGKLQKEIATPPYSWKWNTEDFPNGLYKIEVKAWDVIDQTGKDTIEVRVKNIDKKYKPRR